MVSERAASGVPRSWFWRGEARGGLASSGASYVVG